MIFGGDAFMDWCYPDFQTTTNVLFRIGELSLLKNMMETMEVLGVDPQAEMEEEKINSATSGTTEQETSQGSLDYDATSANPLRKSAYPAITTGSHSSHTVASPDKGSKKRKGLTPEQKEKLQQIQQEQESIRKERVAILSKKLLDKISVWVETDHSATVTEAFKKKMQVCLDFAIRLMVQYEAEVLKLESFGVDLLHAVGLIYTQKATTCLKSSKFLGLGGVWFRTKERGTLVKNAWGTMTSAVDASVAGIPCLNKGLKLKPKK